VKNSHTAALCVACFFAGWILSPGGDSRPLVHPAASHRPVVYFLARAARAAARLGLIAVSISEPSGTPPARDVERTAFDEDGHPIVNHAEGW
jgi:hypothetical protein